MGFWHTGYIEFHEPVGLEGFYTPSPPVYRCQHCNETFSTSEDLRTHRFEIHPVERPCLFLAGIEVGTAPMRITRPIAVSDIEVDRCDKAWVNGIPLSSTELPEKLVGETNDTVTVKLANEGVIAEFVLRYEIASPRDLEGVEHCFLDVAQRGRLDMRAVEDFITAARGFPTAIGYCDGVCEYFYGVLAKERSPESTLPYEVYHQKFNRAEDILKDFDRPLARSISALIAFHFNHFPESITLAGDTRVGVAAGRFRCWIAGDKTGGSHLLTRTFDSGLEKLLTDFETERLINWSVTEPKALLTQLRYLESVVHKDIPEFDRTKLRVLLTELHIKQGNIAEAKIHARELRNSMALGKWAESALERVGNQE